MAQNNHTLTIENDGLPVTTLTTRGSLVAVQTGRTAGGYLRLYSQSGNTTTKLCTSTEYKPNAGQGVFYGGYLYTTDGNTPSLWVWDTASCQLKGFWGLGTSPGYRIATWGKWGYVGAADGVWRVDLGSEPVSGGTSAVRVLNAYAGASAALPVQFPMLVSTIGSTLFVGPKDGASAIQACSLNSVTPTCASTNLTSTFFSSNADDPYLWTDSKGYAWNEFTGSLVSVAGYEAREMQGFPVGDGNTWVWPFKNGSDYRVGQFDFTTDVVGREYGSGLAKVSGLAKLGEWVIAGREDGSIQGYAMEQPSVTTTQTVWSTVTLTAPPSTVTPCSEDRVFLAQMAQDKSEAVTSTKRSLSIALGVPFAVVAMVAVVVFALGCLWRRRRSRSKSADSAGPSESGGHATSAVPVTKAKSTSPAAAAHHHQILATNTNEEPGILPVHVGQEARARSLSNLSLSRPQSRQSLHSLHHPATPPPPPITPPVVTPPVTTPPTPAADV
ncbi:hypothetical protein DFS34DRAFT_614362 [Phlyctochytrium arcticum]|nr:hypothetical protein DFS34DRAFT_614362 [Phlyctochytrium arcticum]